MIEGLLVLAIGALILAYVENQSKKEKIEKQAYKIRHLTHNLNDSDREETKRMADSFHLNQIYKEVVNDDSLCLITPEEWIEESKRRFEILYSQPYAYEVEIDYSIMPEFDTNTKGLKLNRHYHYPTERIVSYKRTLTIEQFKQENGEHELEFLNCKDSTPYFKYGNVIGEFNDKKIPSKPILSYVTNSALESFWMIHEEGIGTGPIIASF